MASFFNKKRKLIGRIGLILFIVALGVMVGAYYCSDCLESTEAAMQTFSYSIILSTSLAFGNSYLIDFIDKKISWVDAPLKRAIVGVLGMVLVSALITFVLVWIFAGQIWQICDDCFIRTMKRNMEIAIYISGIISLILHSRGFLLEWKASSLRTEQLRTAQVNSQYQSLKQQLNPHFLFNSLNALSSLVYQDADKSARFIKQLSNVYRYVLEHANKEIVSLEEELRFLDAYLFLLSIRFDENLKVTYDIPDAQNIFVPPLTLQLLIENAIKHNTVSQSKPLHIQIFEEGEYMVVKNNLQLKMDREDSLGIGLQNLTAQYALLSKRTPIIAESETHFTIKVPLLHLS